jgi:hypothetical protein
MNEETALIPAPDDEPRPEETELIASVPDDRTAVHQLDRAYLLCIGGPIAGRKFAVRFDRTTIGRDEQFCHVLLPGTDKRVSRTHATIQAQGARYVITDKRSRNRTYVNRHKLGTEEEYALNFGDEIEVGPVTFRFVREGQWDWRLPVKSGMFWVRRGGSILLVLTGLVALGGGYLSAGALRYVLAATARPGVLTLSAGPSANVGLSSGAPNYDNDYAPALAYIPRLGHCGIAVIGADGRLVVLDGATLTPATPVDKLIPAQTRALTASDVNGDGNEEIVFATSSGGVATINPSSGVQLGDAQFLQAGILTPAVGDLDGDGYADAAVLTASGKTYFSMGRGSGFKFRPGPEIGGVFVAPPAIADVDGDGKAEVVAVDQDGKVSVIDATSGVSEASVSLSAGAIEQKIGAEVGQVLVYASPAFLQAREQRGQLMVWTDYYGLTVAQAVRGDRTDIPWANRLGALLDNPVQQQVVSRNAGPVCANLNSDKYPDVVLGTVYGPLAAVDGRSGRLLWSYGDASRWQAIVATPALYDFDKDGTADVVCADNQGGVHVVSGHAGSALATVSGDGVPVYASPLVGDVDGDGSMDIVVENTAGVVKILKTNSRTPSARPIWPTQSGTGRRTGASGFSGFDSGRRLVVPIMTAGALLILLVAYLVRVLQFRRRRRQLERIGAS